MMDWHKFYDLNETYLPKMKEALTMDTEDGHYHADAVMCALLRELGFDEIVDMFHKREWWYA